MKNIADEFIPIVQRCAKCNKIYYAPRQVIMCPCFLGERVWIKQIANIVGIKVAMQCLHSTDFQQEMEINFRPFYKIFADIPGSTPTDLTPIPSETIFRKYFT